VHYGAGPPCWWLVACCLWLVTHQKMPGCFLGIQQAACYGRLWTMVLSCYYLFFFSFVSFLLCLVPVHGDELASIPTGVWRYWCHLFLQMRFEPKKVLASLQLRWLHISAGLSFKSGYQQTGYVHPILSYYDVKYYYCLLLEACGSPLGALSCTTLQDLGKVIPYTYKWSNSVLATALFSRWFTTHLTNFVFDTWPENQQLLHAGAPQCCYWFTAQVWSSTADASSHYELITLFWLDPRTIVSKSWAG